MAGAGRQEGKEGREVDGSAGVGAGGFGEGGFAGERLGVERAIGLDGG